ncbi:MAG: Crp/Fnr family transcriptional regulator [bacterium]|nr:Crp/Fnr family transcriptional regulator [bacterium]
MNALLKQKIETRLSNFDFNEGLKLNSLPEHVRYDLLERGTHIELPRKEALYREGDSPKGIYILKSGKIKITQLSVDGTVQILFIFSDGVIFGHRTILGNDKQTISALALENCKLIFIEKEHFLKVLHSSPEFSRILIQSVSHEFTILINRINIFAQRGIKERLALFLLMLNETYRIPNQFQYASEINMNRNDLAAFIGTSVENLVRTLRTFKANNYVSTSGKSIFITDFDMLYTLAKI